MAREGILSKCWSYDYGVVWNGFEALYNLTGDARYLDYIRHGIDSFLSADGTQIRDYCMEDYNLDYINNGKQLLYLYRFTGEMKYIRAASLLNLQLENQPRTSGGGFWHKKIYPYQMWLDGLYMAAPFYARYSLDYQASEGLDDVANQFTLIHQHTYNASTGLCCHAWDESRTQPWADPVTGLSRHAWGRALGWYLAALVDVLPSYPPEHPQREILLSILRMLCESVQRRQDRQTFVWQQVLDAPGRPGNYFESSCSCLFAYTFAKGARLDLLPPSFMEHARRAYEGIVTQFIQVLNGHAAVTKCCQVAGLGGQQNRDGSFAYYISEPIVCNDLKGIGAFLQAACEIEGSPYPAFKNSAM